MLASQPFNYKDYVEDILRPEDIHEVQRAAPGLARVGQALLFSIILTIVHGIVLYVLMSGMMAPAIPLLIHVIISAVLILWTWAQYKAGLDVPFMALLALTSAVAGVFGAAGTLLCIFLYGIFVLQNTVFSEWFNLIFPTDPTSDPEETYMQIISGRDENPVFYDVLPFLDVMELGSTDQKHRALSKMTMNFHPKLAPAFMRALKDENNAIRVQAATAVAKIESDFMKTLARIEDARALRPNDEKLKLATARFYDDYAWTGLLDDEREMLNQKKAISTYKSFLQHEPGNEDATAAVGRLLFRGKQWDEAAKWFEQMIHRGVYAPGYVLWYLECLWNLGDYGRLRQVARQYSGDIRENETIPREVRDAVALWAAA
jgi:pentatricopeptide repeat protein